MTTPSVIILTLSALATLARAGFYADNGLDRTISYRSLPKREKREMENEILNLLGLDHRPMPKIHQTSNSAPRYLIDLYNQLDLEADDRNASFRDVDFVVSFVNHHNNLEDELSIEPKLRFDVSDISPQETVMHAALNLYRRNTRNIGDAQSDVDVDPLDDTQPASSSLSAPAQPAASESANVIPHAKSGEDEAPRCGPESDPSESTCPTSPETPPPPAVSETTTTASDSDQNTVETTINDENRSSSTTTDGDATVTDVSSEMSTGPNTPSGVPPASPATTEAITGTETTSDLPTPTPSKERLTRSTSAVLDYPDEFAFFDQPFEVQVFCMRHGNSIGDIALEAVANYTVGANETGWIRLNATNPLVNWVGFPGENFGLVVRLIDPESGLQLSPSQVGLVMGATGEFAPFMAAFMKEGSGGRRRSTRASERTRRERPPVSHINDDVPSYEIRHHFPRRNSCQKRNLYVSFRDLGWADWIIAPDGYAASYCDGECSFPLNMNATNHAIVQTLVHLVDPTQAPTACCGPTKLAPIMVLYFDDNSNVILKKYRNMVVRSCGCH